MNGQLRLLQGLLGPDGLGQIGLQRLVVDAIQHRRHDEKRHEEGDADQHLVGGALLQTDGLAQDAEHHDDPGEGGHHDHHGRQEGERGHQRQHLQGQAVLLTAIRHGLDGECRHAVLGHRQGREHQGEQCQPPGPVNVFHACPSVCPVARRTPEAGSRPAAPPGDRGS